MWECRDCGELWNYETTIPCPKCGSKNVESDKDEQPYTRARQHVVIGTKEGEQWGKVENWDLGKAKKNCKKCYGRGILAKDTVTRSLILCKCVPMRKEEVGA